MDLFTFILVNAALFIRPAEVFPSLIGMPIYNALMIACLMTCFGKVVRQFSGELLAERPITCCVLGIAATIILSHLARLDTFAARMGLDYFYKVLLYYLFLVSVVDTPARLRSILRWLAILILVVTSLAVLQYHDKIQLEGFTAVEDVEIDAKTGEEYIVRRMCGTGIFNDPNDFCLLMILGICICLYEAGDREGGPLRLLWLGVMGFFGYALTLTYSRGGMLGLIVGIMTYLYARFGWRKMMPLAVVVMPAMLVMGGGRQMNFSASDDTGQQRIQLWVEGLMLLRRSPLCGIGWDRYHEELGLVAHNSFIHSFVELGFVGGAMFLGAFTYALGSLRRIGPGRGTTIIDPELRRVRPYLMGLIAGYGAGIFTISRSYIIPTYLVLGLATAFLGLARTEPPTAPEPFDGRLIRRFAINGVCFLVLLYVYTRVAARYG